MCKLDHDSQLYISLGRNTDRYITIIENIWCFPKLVSLHNDIISTMDPTDLSTLCLQRATLFPLELKVSLRYLKVSSTFISSPYTVREFTSDFPPLILRSLHLSMDNFSHFLSIISVIIL